MAKEYIEREALLQKLAELYLNADLWSDVKGLNMAKNAIENQPTADVQEVRHGNWLNFYGDYTTAECSFCGECFEVTFDKEANGALFEGFRQFYKYCPNCGAKMDKE